MELLGQLGAIGAVLALLAGFLWCLRRRGIVQVLPARWAGERRLRSVERLVLGPQHTLHLVRLGGRALLVGCSPGGCTLVRSFPIQELEGERGREA